MEYTSTYKDEENIGRIQISEEVIAVIAGIAASEVKGVVSLGGNLAIDLISKIGIKSLATGVKIHVLEDTIVARVNLNIDSNYNIPTVCRQVQEKVSSTIETMTGMSVVEVDVFVDHVTVRRA